MMRSLLFAFMIVAWISESLMAATGSKESGRELEKVRLQLKWRHQFQSAGYYAAIEQGYYRDAGLNVELIEGSPDHDPVAEVESGGAEYGVGTSELLLLRAQGHPLVVLAAVFQHSPTVLLDPIRKAADRPKTRRSLRMNHSLKIK